MSSRRSMTHISMCLCNCQRACQSTDCESSSLILIYQSFVQHNMTPSPIDSCRCCAFQELCHTSPDVIVNFASRMDMVHPHTSSLLTSVCGLHSVFLEVIQHHIKRFIRRKEEYRGIFMFRAEHFNCLTEVCIPRVDRNFC